MNRSCGLLFDSQINLEPILGAPVDFTVPEWVDSRPLCLPSSNQGPESSCAGYATAGFIEVNNWKKTGVQTQVDGSLIYKKAKEIDGQPKSDGTTLTKAVLAAKILGLLPEKQNVRVVQSRLDVQFALHKYGVCIVGFNITDEWDQVGKLTGFIANNENHVVRGGHATLLCYYDSLGVGWQNSWDVTWGVKGFGRMSWPQFDEQFMYGVVLEE